MEWFKIVSQLVVSLLWPAIVLTLVMLFRREIKGLLSAVKEVKYPGGSITVEVAKLEEKVEKAGTKANDIVNSRLLSESFLIKQGDPQLAIAQMRIDLQKELFRLSWAALDRKDDMKGWDISKHIDELDASRVLEREIAESLRMFVRISDDIIHGAGVTDEIKSRSTTVGASLIAQLHYQRKVLEMEDDFEGHGLWHMYTHLPQDVHKYYFWSAVAASLPEFDYNYDIYRDAAEQYNRKVEAREGLKQRSRHTLPILPLDEIVKVLEFREKELLRLINVWHNPQGNDWKAFEKANEWQWPPEWGHLGWSGPIIRERLSLYTVEDDLMQTRTALNRYRMQLLEG